MKVFIVLKEFILDFPDEQTRINEKTIRNWFEGSRFALVFSSKIKYELSTIVKNSFSYADDGLCFKLDWVKIKKWYDADKEFLKKIEHLPKRVK